MRLTVSIFSATHFAARQPSKQVEADHLSAPPLAFLRLCAPLRDPTHPRTHHQIVRTNRSEPSATRTSTQPRLPKISFTVSI